MPGSRVFIRDGAGVMAVPCPDCGHTRCGEDCACNCDAAHAEHKAARLTAEVERLRGALDKIGRWQVSLEACVQFARRALADADTGEGRGE